MRRATFALSALILALIGSLQLSGAAQDAAGPGASITYDIVSSLTLHEPVVLSVVARNETAERLFIDLGRNRMGNSQITITTPTGARTVIDERIPKTMFGGSGVGRLYVEPHSHLEVEVVLNEFADLSGTGLYRIDAEFIGRVEWPNGTPIAIARRWKGEVLVLARNGATLRDVCDRLVHQIESTLDSQTQAMAVRKLAVIADPAAVEYLGRAAKASYLVRSHGIPALERIGNDEARAVLVGLLGGDDIDHADAARQALARLDRLAAPKR